MAYQPINASEVDLDSPITEGLMQRFRNNSLWFLALFGASTGHKHDGTANEGAPVKAFPSSVVASKNITVNGTLTAGQFIDWYAIFLGRW